MAPWWTGGRGTVALESLLPLQPILLLWMQRSLQQRETHHGRQLINLISKQFYLSIILFIKQFFYFIGVPLTSAKWTEHLKVHKAQDPKKAEEKVIILNLNINFNIKFISAIGS